MFIKKVNAAFQLDIYEIKDVNFFFLYKLIESPVSLYRSLGGRFQDWASLVAQMVKNQPAMQETWVRSLGWKDLEPQFESPALWALYLKDNA